VLAVWVTNLTAEAIKLGNLSEELPALAIIKGLYAACDHDFAAGVLLAKCVIELGDDEVFGLVVHGVGPFMRWAQPNSQARRPGVMFGAVV